MRFIITQIIKQLSYKIDNTVMQIVFLDFQRSIAQIKDVFTLLL